MHEFWNDTVQTGALILISISLLRLYGLLNLHNKKSVFYPRARTITYIRMHYTINELYGSCSGLCLSQALMFRAFRSKLFLPCLPFPDKKQSENNFFWQFTVQNIFAIRK